MKRIAMLNCLKANEVCSGASCMSAFNYRKASFMDYGDEEQHLTAFMRCGGCDLEPANYKGMMQKIERIIQEETEVAHVGICTITHETKLECENIAKIISMFEDKGIIVVRGTH
ncbi:MAG: CGGC domain-containing protein [Eubacteriaceae bacterium]|nr:CGGC domain-containing protein [Eubacteriaceae bacterium]